MVLGIITHFLLRKLRFNKKIGKGCLIISKVIMVMNQIKIFLRIRVQFCTNM